MDISEYYNLFAGLLWIIALVWVVPSFLIAWLIGSKRKIGFGFTLLICLLVSPVIGLVIALVSGPNEPDEGDAGRFVQEQSVAGEIEKLHRLKERGVISPEEFEQSKSKLLRRPF
jgi:uncharacterized membrane protein